MKKSKKMLYVCDLLILAFILILKKNIYLMMFLILFMGFLLYKYGFPRDKHYLKSNVIRIIIISLLSYFLIAYGIGIIVGFTKNVFSLRLYRILSNISVPLIVIVCEEIIRYIYAKNCQSDIKPYLLLTIVYIFLSIIMETNGYLFNDFEDIFVFITLIVFRVVAYEFLFSYLTYKVSFVPSLIIRLVINLYIYFVPIFPNLGNYLTSVFGIMYPTTVYFLIYRMIKYYSKDNEYVVKIRRNYVLYPVIIVLLILTILISGIGKYRMVAIGSGSMEPVYYRGDAVIYKRISQNEKIEVNRIIAYEKNGTLITHRVVNVSEINGSYVYKTKGDKNLYADDYVVYENDIFGVVIYKLSYIGYPTIWFNEFLGKLK